MIMIDPFLSVSKQEIKYFVALGLEKEEEGATSKVSLPPALSEISQRAEGYRRDRGNLEMIATMYNFIQVGK